MHLHDVLSLLFLFHTAFPLLIVLALCLKHGRYVFILFLLRFSVVVADVCRLEGAL